MTGNRGLGLPETMLSMSLLLLGLAVIFELFMMGSKSFLSGERQHDLSRQATVALDRLTRNLEAAPPESLTLSPGAVSFLSCRDQNNQSQLTPTGDSAWQAYQIYFLDDLSKELRERRIPLATPASLAVPIEDYNDGAGTHPLTFYLQSQQVVARSLAVFRLEEVETGRLELTLRFELPAQGRQPARHLEIKTSLLLRLQ